MRHLFTNAVFVSATFVLSAAAPSTAQTAANAQVTDSVTQTNVKVIGDAPDLSTGDLYQEISRPFADPTQSNVILVLPEPATPR